MDIEAEVAVSSPIIEDFLYVLDPTVPANVDANQYSIFAINAQILGDDSIVQVEPQVAETTLPDFCPNREAQEDFDALANELAAEQTRTAYAESQQIAVCEQ